MIPLSMARIRHAALGATFLFAVLAFAVGFVDSAQGVEIKEVSSTVSQHQAGGHSDSTVRFRFATENSVDGTESGPCEEAIEGEAFGAEYCAVKGGAPRDASVQLPEGMVGSLRGLGHCTLNQLSRVVAECPLSSQVGFGRISFILFGVARPPTVIKFAIYNMVPARGEAALFGFRAAGTDNAFISLRVHNNGDGDYRLMADGRSIFSGLPITAVETTIWGDPANNSHDAERFCSIPAAFGCEGKEAGYTGAVMTNPPVCGIPQVTSLRARSWLIGGENDWAEANSAPEFMEGCEHEQFSPTFSAGIEGSSAGAPTGLGVHLALPDTYEAVEGIATPPLKDATVTLPVGMSLNPSTANGLGACTTDEMQLEADAHAECPESSKIGEVKVTTPLLSEEFTGAAFIGSQLSNDPTSGDMYRMMLEIENEERGVDIKVPGQISVDPGTGQVTAKFLNNPQLPFTTLDVRLKGGPRAPLSLPAACGTYAVTAHLVGWGVEDRAVDLSSPFTVDQNCGDSSQFTPTLEAGTTSTAGGSYAPFTLRLTRPDGQANVSSLEATLPEGLLAKLAGIPLCGDAQAATGDCPASSQVGTTVVGAGAGSSPVYVPQPGRAPTGVYLAGPYKGAPYSLVVKVPAQAGPFDLGTVAVRNALYVDQTTTQVTAKSDPLPQILQGIPISYRDIRVEVDRPEFTLNPTSCDPMEITSTITASGGQRATPSSRFQAAGCESLAFQPKLALSLKGQTRRAGHPALKATLTFPEKGRFANIARAQVGLPHSLFLDQGNLDKVCRQADLKAGTCPASSVYGKARAWSPLLDRPLEGPVVLGVGFGHKLPDLVAELDGQIRVLLNGKVDTTKQKGLRNTFEAVPDAPVSKFVIELKGGKRYGLIENSENLCRKAQKASVQFTAHNGRSLHLDPKIGLGCKKAKGKRKGGR